MIECPIERLRKMSLADRWRFGTAGKGLTSSRAKLTADDVRAIRRRCEAGERQKDIGRDFGVSQDSISKIKLGVRYKDVT